MNSSTDELSRISKLLIDREQTNTEAALVLRKGFVVTLSCGEDVAVSYTLQLAVLTAASIACRCFPGAVRVNGSSTLANTPLLLWPWLGLTFGEGLTEVLGYSAWNECAQTPPRNALIFGDAPTSKGALRVSFDGWVAKVGPADGMARLMEREYFSPVGVCAASLALSELFLSFAGISIAATRRIVSVSLWRPNLDPDDPGALGIPVEYLPRELWVLGLGHLGNAYLWTIAALPYEDPNAIELALLDFDKVEKSNVETGIIFNANDVGEFKAQACSSWLRHRRFRTRLVERRFDVTFRLQASEPVLALCGFDANAARRALPSAQFRRVIDNGLGGMANNFDTISFHTFPNPRKPEDLWPDMSEEEIEKLVAYEGRIANENKGYADLGRDECGRRQLAGKSVAVPFVGAIAAALAVAEAVRLLHGGPAFSDIKFGLGDLDRRLTRTAGNYSPEDAAGVKFVEANRRA